MSRLFLYGVWLFLTIVFCILNIFLIKLYPIASLVALLVVIFSALVSEDWEKDALAEVKTKAKKARRISTEEILRAAEASGITTQRMASASNDSLVIRLPNNVTYRFVPLHKEGNRLRKQ